ncbi:MAG: DUF4476 domain-containing protein [Bacteroidetes bacterium]|nr:MAG: DUF4476 domain-containing protein [Bacteroidota bacterium]
MKKLFTLITACSTFAAFAQNTNVDIDMNMGGFGVDMNVNVNESYTETYTTTTTTTTTTGAAQPQHYVMPGYSGPIGCPWPMDEGQFANAQRSVTSKDFEESKMTVAKQITGANCLTADQVRRMMGAFDFEQTKLDYAKFAYNKTYDIGNYYMLNDAFDFESSIDELNDYINGR